MESEEGTLVAYKEKYKRKGMLLFRRDFIKGGCQHRSTASPDKMECRSTRVACLCGG